jgi:hypothetical protein
MGAIRRWSVWVFLNFACIGMAMAHNTAVADMPGLKIEHVFGPEIPTGKYKHPASLTELSNGDLYLVYYGGEGEYAIDTGVFGARLKKGDTHWSRPQRFTRRGQNVVG